MDCAKRKSCVEPCEWLEAELKKVTVYQRERHQIYHEYDKEPHDDDKINFKRNEQKEAFYRDIVDGANRLQIIRLVYDLHQQGKIASEIAYHIPQTKRFINQIIATINITPKEKNIDRLIKKVDANLMVK